MIAWLTEVGIAAAAVTAIIAAGYAIAKLPPLRWLWHNIIARGWKAVASLPLSRWIVGVIRPVVVEEVAPLKAEMEERLDAQDALGERVEGKVDDLTAKVAEVHTDVKNGNGA